MLRPPFLMLIVTCQCRNERHASWRIEKDQLKDLRVGFVPEKSSR
jgi:ABC-type phosphate/phosphonate transport system substrate-binding protein